MNNSTVVILVVIFRITIRRVERSCDKKERGREEYECYKLDNPCGSDGRLARVMIIWSRDEVNNTLCLAPARPDPGMSFQKIIFRDWIPPWH